MMKLLMDERLKHRIIGLAVVVSIAAIFAPAIIKKSHQRFDANVNVSIKLPPKPILPNVPVAKEKTVFETVKVAHVEIPPIPKPTKQVLAQAQPLNQPAEVKQAVGSMVAQAKVEPLIRVKPKSSLVLAATKVISKQKKQVKPLSATIKPNQTVRLANAKDKEAYFVQLATFTKQQNAEVLLKKLRLKGYKAAYNKISTPTGPVYKVIVGQGDPKEVALHLQKQLASSMQINGFIITTKVS